MLRVASAFELYDAGAATDLLAAESDVWSHSSPASLSIVADGMHSLRAVRNASAQPLNAAVTLDASTSQIIVQAAFKLGAAAAQTLLSVVGGLGYVVTLAVTAAGEVVCYDANSSVVGTSSRGTVAAGAWRYLELQTFRSSAGRIRVRLDGVTLFDLSGQETSGDSGDISKVEFGGSATGISWSDVIVMDGAGAQCNRMLGPRARLRLLAPIANGASADWDVAGASLGYQAVDDGVPGARDTATYIESATNNEKNTFAFEKVAAEAEDIQGVRVLAEALHSGSPSLRLLAVSGSTEATGDVETPGASYKVLRLDLPRDPATQTRWSRASVAALRAGAQAAT